MPSGGLSGAELSQRLCKNFNIDYDPTLRLSDIATLVEIRRNRRPLINFIGQIYEVLRPTKGLLNLPMFPWQAIFTTNYDTLIEQAYKIAGKPLRVFSSNFDFTETSTTPTAELFKIHGTLGEDRALGHQASMVITNEDYDLAQKFRELAFDRLLHETSRNDVLIIGHSLADPDLIATLDEAIRRKKVSGAPGRIYTLIYREDQNRALLYEQKGLNVCFGGIDDFLATASSFLPASALVFSSAADDLLARAPLLRPVTIDVRHSLNSEAPDAVRLFNGGPAKYGDIRAELTFRRDISQRIETQLADAAKPVAYVLGVAGFGKSTACRQVLVNLSGRSFHCWEHEPDHDLQEQGWITVASACKETETNAVLFVDDAHLHLRQIDRIIDHLAETENRFFRLLLASAPGSWHPRAKTPAIYRIGVPHEMGRLSNAEINSLVQLFERKREIAVLVEPAFGGFDRPEKIRRLQERCKQDMFVCLKNIFGFEKLDDIILKDYGLIEERLQDIYKVVAAMEASNVRVHRQLVMRVLGIPGNVISGILAELDGIISEYTVDETNGIYGWRGRHRVISEIILKYKYYDQDALFDLYKRVIENINPSYEMERMTANEICDPNVGIGRINERQRQNFLYRKLISVAPSQRVPRHRLVQNLIRAREYEIAENEIRVFEQELKVDAPMLRYRAQIRMGRARNTPGLMKEDRIAILREAASILDHAVDRFPADKALHSTHCDAGLAIAELDGKWDIYDTAFEKLQIAEREFLDPEMGRLIARIRAKARGEQIDN